MADATVNTIKRKPCSGRQLDMVLDMVISSQLVLWQVHGAQLESLYNLLSHVIRNMVGVESGVNDPDVYSRPHYFVISKPNCLYYSLRETDTMRLTFKNNMGMYADSYIGLKQKYQ